MGELKRAEDQIRRVLERDPRNYRALQLFAEVQQALRDPEPVFKFLRQNVDYADSLPPTVLVQLSETLVSGEAPPEPYRELSRKLLSIAARGRLEERELRRIIVALLRSDEEGVLSLIDSQLKEHPEWRDNPSLLQLRGDAILGLARRCRVTAKKREIPRATKTRAWRQFHEYLSQAERELDRPFTCRGFRFNRVDTP